MWLQGLAQAEDDGFQHITVTAKHRVAPRYPSGAPGPARCLVMAWVDERGRPHEPEVQGCPTLFAQSAAASILRWRWGYSPPVDKHEPRQTLIFTTMKFAQSTDAPFVPPARCEWTVGVDPNGELSVSKQAPLPCALFLPKEVTLPELVSECRVLRRSRSDEDVSECPEAMQKLAKSIVTRSFFGETGEDVLTVVPVP
jgi:hypothetical protein